MLSRNSIDENMIVRDVDLIPEPAYSVSEIRYLNSPTLVIGLFQSNHSLLLSESVGQKSCK